MTEYWIWLSCALNGANNKTDELLKKYSNPQNIYENRKDLSSCGISFTKTEYNALMNTSLSQAYHIMETSQKEEVKILTPDMSEFPERFLEINAVPLALYVKGKVETLSDNVSAAVVGTRHPTDYALKATYKLSYDLASAGTTIVSGCAHGIDSYAHWAAINAGGKTVAFLASGLNVEYPTGQINLKSKIIENGALVTEYPFDVHAEPNHFRPRNRLMAALTLGTIVVQAPESSGALITAHHAIEQGKDVYVVPDSIFNSKAVGSLTLLKDSAFLMTKANDFLLNYIHRYPEEIDLEKILLHTDYTQQKDVINSSMQKKTLKDNSAELGNKRRALAELSDSVTGLPRLIYEELLNGPADVETIAIRLGCDPSQVYSELTALEIEECIGQDENVLYIPEVEIE